MVSEVGRGQVVVEGVQGGEGWWRGEEGREGKIGIVVVSID